MKNPAPYRYDIVGSFLRTAAIHEARAKFASGAISAEELSNIEDTEIRGLVQKEELVGLKAVTDGEYRRSFWHMDFLWGLTGTQKVKSEHFSVAFKGFQPKAETHQNCGQTRLSGGPSISEAFPLPEKHHCGWHSAEAVHPVSVHAASDLLYP